MGDLVLSAAQERVVDAVAALSPGSALIVSGFAGAGKSTTLAEVFKRHGAKMVMTPTGKAAARLRAVKTPARTIHSVLYTPREAGHKKELQWDLREDDELHLGDGDLVIVDEASMVGPRVAADLRGLADRFGLRLVLIGDGFQLPPVLAPDEHGAWAEGFSVMRGDGFETAERLELTEVFRQALDSPVLRAATEIRRGGSAKAEAGDARFVALDGGPARMADSLVGAIKRGFDVVGITWRNQDRHVVNKAAREQLGRKNALPEPGEPLVVLANAKFLDLWNGEVVTFLEALAPPQSLRPYTDFPMGVTCKVRRPDGREQVVLLVLEFLGGGERQGVTPSTCYREHFGISSAKRASMLIADWGYCLTAHKCVSPSTIVETPRGLRPIRDLPVTPGWVATALGEKLHTGRVDVAPSPMVRVETQRGYSVDVTLDHGFFTWGGGAYDRRVVARDLREGNWLRLRLGAVCDPLVAPVLPPALAVDVRAVIYALPPGLTADVAEFFGAMVADGTVWDSGFRLVKRHEDDVDRVAALIRVLFGVEPKRRVVAPNGTDTFHVEVNSTFLADWLRAVGGMAPNGKAVPECVMRASVLVQAAFLRGLFMDGTVNVKGGVADHIEWVTTFEDLGRIVQILLLRQGIPSSRKGYGGLTHLYIYGGDMTLFAQRVGFTAQFKQSRLGEEAPGTRYTLPISANEIRLARSFMRQGERNNAVNRKTITRHKLHELVRRGATALVGRTEWFDDQVARVVPLGDAASMCVSVPDVGRFLQNGFDGSNSQGSEWDVAIVHASGGLFTVPDGWRRWVYTAMTRAKTALAVVADGQMRAAFGIGGRRLSTSLLRPKDERVAEQVSTPEVAPERVYFSHSVRDFGRPAAATVRTAIASRWPQATLLDPEKMDLPALAKARGGWEEAYRAVIHEQVGKAGAVAVLEHMEHVGRGVFAEVRNALEVNIPVWAFRGGRFQRVREVQVANESDWKVTYGRLVLAVSPPAG